MHTFKDTMFRGMDRFGDRIERTKALYENVLEYASAERNGCDFVRLTDKKLFVDVLENLGIVLKNEDAKHDLSTIYEIGIHLSSGALLIANKGATLFCLSPKTQTPYITRHIGCCIYMPGLGVEVVNVGLTGNVYDGPVVLRSESACTPSFLFGSQRCNCAHQWEAIRELSAHFNKITTPSIQSGREFELWVQDQFTHEKGKHIAATSGQGIITMHLDTQNGMGSGFSADEFSFDLFSRASLRHRGEYSAEQIHQTSMAGGFHAIGIKPDPRSENDECGYKITPVVLDWLGTSRDLIFLSNNKSKIRQLEAARYRVQRVMSIGMVNTAGAQEAEERGTEFDHMDIGPALVSFEEEMGRLISEVTSRSPECSKAHAMPPWTNKTSQETEC